MKHIVVINAHWNNRGDEAAIRAILDSILHNIPEAVITVVFKERGKIEQFPYEKKIHCMTSRFLLSFPQMLMALLFRGKFGCSAEVGSILSLIEEADFVVYAPGGAVISDRFWWKKQLEYLFPIVYAEKKKIPVFFAAPSIGPFYQKRYFRDSVLKRVSHICVREEISASELRRQGIEKNVSVTIDSAFLNDIDKEANQKILEKNIALKSFLEKYSKVVGITMTDFRWHVEYGKRENLREQIKIAFTEFISYLEGEGTGVLFIPQLFGNQNDRGYLAEFETGNTFLMSDDLDAYFQQFIISKLYAVVGMRYHSNIFAAKMGVPFVPVVYEEKMAGFLQMAALEETAVALEELTADTLVKRYIWVDKNAVSIKKMLTESREVWREKAEQTEKKMLQFFSGKF